MKKFIQKSKTLLKIDGNKVKICFINKEFYFKMMEIGRKLTHNRVNRSKLTLKKTIKKTVCPNDQRKELKLIDY